MRSNNLTPRTKARCGLSFHGYARLLTLLAANLLVEFDSQDFGLHLIGLLNFGRGHGGEQARDAVNGTICVIGTEGFLVSPLVPDITKFANKAPVRWPKNLSKAIVPQIPHHAQQCLRVPIQIFGIFPGLLPIREAWAGGFCPPILVRCLQFALYKRSKASV